MNTENNNHSNIKQSFWKDKKNIVIVILSGLLFITIVSYPNSNTNISNSQDINLISTVNELQLEITDKENEIKTLQENNKSLIEKNEKLENEKKELNLKSESSEKNVSKNSSSQTNSYSKKTTSKYSSPTSENISSPSKKQTSSSTKQTSKMVWVGETGTKYHIQSCRTLKGKGHQITLKQALAEGREPCKVCH